MFWIRSGRYPISNFKTTELLGFDPLQNTYDVVLDMGKAIALFDELADRSDIPHGYMRTGCFERSVIMVDLMLEAGYKPERVWAHNKTDGAIIYQSEDGEMAAWGYHVAPALKIETELGKDETIVFDPAIFDGPVRIDQWQKHMRGANKITMLPYYDRADNAKYIDLSEPWDETVEMIKSLLPDLQSEQGRTMGDVKRMVWESSIKKEFCARAGVVRKASGQTWVTKRSFSKPKFTPS